MFWFRERFYHSKSDVETVSGWLKSLVGICVLRSTRLVPLVGVKNSEEQINKSFECELISASSGSHFGAKSPTRRAKEAQDSSNVRSEGTAPRAGRKFSKEDHLQEPRNYRIRSFWDRRFRNWGPRTFGEIRLIFGPTEVLSTPRGRTHHSSFTIYHSHSELPILTCRFWEKTCRKLYVCFWANRAVTIYCIHFRTVAWNSRFPCLDLHRPAWPSCQYRGIQDFPSQLPRPA